MTGKAGIFLHGNEAGPKVTKAVVEVVEDDFGKRIFGDKHIVAMRFGVSLPTVEDWIAKRHPDYTPFMFYSRALKNGSGGLSWVGVGTRPYRPS